MVDDNACMDTDMPIFIVASLLVVLNPIGP
jgi:hypothetical protein